jgi:hypothetical protein
MGPKTDTSMQTAAGIYMIGFYEMELWSGISKCKILS